MLDLKTKPAGGGPGQAESGPHWYLKFVAKLIVLALLTVGVLKVRIPLVILEPGPTRDAGKLIRIGTQTYSSKGSFLLTTAVVNSVDGVTPIQAARAALDADQELVTKESIFPSHSTRLNTDRVHAAQMSESQEVGAVAALHELGVSVAADGAFVRTLNTASGASGVLQPGDLITAVDGRPVVKVTDLTGYVRTRSPGQAVWVTLKRNGNLHRLRVKTVLSQSKPRRTVLGVYVVQNSKLPFDMSVNAGNIGGPSAGLIFGLAIYDALTPGDLSGGRKIAGTGTITNAGRTFGKIGPIGGVAEKVRAAQRAGVDVFLAPKDDFNDAKRSARGTAKVIGVASLHEAIRALQRLNGA